MGVAFLCSTTWQLIERNLDLNARGPAQTMNASLSEDFRINLWYFQLHSLIGKGLAPRMSWFDNNSKVPVLVARGSPGISPSLGDIEFCLFHSAYSINIIRYSVKGYQLQYQIPMINDPWCAHSARHHQLHFCLFERINSNIVRSLKYKSYRSRWALSYEVLIIKYGWNFVHKLSRGLLGAYSLSHSEVPEI